MNFTGFNKILKSRFLQALINKMDDGTFGDFLQDWKWIFSYGRRYKKQILLYTVLGILSAALGLGSSVVSKYMIDIIVGRKMEMIWLLALMMVSSLVVSLVFSSLVSRISAKISISVHNDIQADIFRQVMAADWQALGKFQSGDLLNRFGSDVHTISSNAVNWLPNVIITAFHFLATFCVILYYDAVMALIALISAPVLLLAGRYMMRRLRHHREQVLKMNSDLMSFESEAFYNMDTIKSFGVTDQYGLELEKWQGRYKAHNLDYNLFQIKSNAAMKLITAFVSFVAFGYCLLRLWSGAISFGTMTLFLQQHSALSGQFHSLVGILPNMLGASVSARRIREITQLPRENRDTDSAEKLKAVAEDGLTVRMQGVKFSYEEDQNVITGSDFVARPGEIVALAGPSGQGKTTLLRLMLGLVGPNEGRVSLVGKDGMEMDMNADLRQFFSYVPQGNTILSGTIAQNLRLVKPDAADEEMEQALKTACAWEFVKAMPKGIHSPVGEQGRGLSEGQAQRIAIARAVLRDAPVILLDEATSALDADTEKTVLENIVRQHPNKTCIVTTHRSSVLRKCQRVYHVTGKQVTEVTE